MNSHGVHPFCIKRASVTKLLTDPVLLLLLSASCSLLSTSCLFGDCEMSAVFKVLLWKAPRNRIHFTFFDFLIQFDFLKFRGLLLKPNFSQSTPGQTFMNVVCRIHECGWKCKVIGGGGQHGVVHHHVLENKKSLFQMLILKIKSYFDSDD